MSEYENDVFDDQQEFEEALAGYMGDEYQQIAEALNDELPDEEAEYEGDGHALFEAELARLEERLGRSLTHAETRRLGNAVPADGPIPDLVKEYGDELAERNKRAAESADVRRALMLERAEDAVAEAEAEGPGPDAGLTPAGNRITSNGDGG
jgi:hypothetical protein